MARATRGVAVMDDALPTFPLPTGAARYVTGCSEFYGPVSVARPTSVGWNEPAGPEIKRVAALSPLVYYMQKCSRPFGHDGEHRGAWAATYASTPEEASAVRERSERP